MRPMLFIFLLLVATSVFGESFSKKYFTPKYAIDKNTVLEVPRIQSSHAARLTEFNFSCNETCEIIVLFDKEDKNAKSILLTLTNTSEDGIKQKFYAFNRLHEHDEIRYIVFEYFYSERKTPSEDDLFVSLGGAASKKLSNNDPSCEDFFKTLDKIANLRYASSSKYLNKNGSLKKDVRDEISQMVSKIKKYFKKGVFEDV